MGRQRWTRHSPFCCYCSWVSLWPVSICQEHGQLNKHKQEKSWFGEMTGLGRVRRMAKLWNPWRPRNVCRWHGNSRTVAEETWSQVTWRRFVGWETFGLEKKRLGGEGCCFHIPERVSWEGPGGGTCCMVGGGGESRGPNYSSEIRVLPRQGCP